MTLNYPEIIPFEAWGTVVQVLVEKPVFQKVRGQKIHSWFHFLLEGYLICHFCSTINTTVFQRQF